MSDKDIDAGLVLHRLNSIDKTLADVSKSIERLVLVEERQSQTNAAMERAFKELDGHNSRITGLERSTEINNRTSVWVERALLACAGALAAIVVKVVVL